MKFVETMQVDHTTTCIICEKYTVIWLISWEYWFQEILDNLCFADALPSELSKTYGAVGDQKYFCRLNISFCLSLVCEILSSEYFNFYFSTFKFRHPSSYFFFFRKTDFHIFFYKKLFSEQKWRADNAPDLRYLSWSLFQGRPRNLSNGRRFQKRSWTSTVFDYEVAIFY